MKFDDLDAKMRVFETAHDHCVLPGIHIVAQLDGRGFTRLTKQMHHFEAPFDERFRDVTLATTTRSTSMIFPIGKSAALAFSGILTKNLARIPKPEKK